MSPSIPEDVVASLVGEVSDSMSDPSYAQIAIGELAQAHPDVGHFITAHLDELGSSEAVIHAVFHAEIIHRCFRRHRGSAIAAVTFSDLNEIGADRSLERLETSQPAIASYLVSNLEGASIRRLLAHVALAMGAKT